MPIRPSHHSAAVVLLLFTLIASSCNMPGLALESPVEIPPTSSTVIAPITTTPGPEPAIPTIAIADATQPAPIPSDTPAATAAPTLEASPTAIPEVPEPAGPQLAFLNEKNLWLLDQPGAQPYQITTSGDIQSFAWTPDRQRLATLNGQKLCFILRDGSPEGACTELELDQKQAQIDRQIALSPDGKWAVLWNPINPWEDDSIGWMIVALDGSQPVQRIQDPVEFGAALAPNSEAGGITGQALFLPDGQLVGTLTHRSLCSSNGCHYQLYEYDLGKKSFSAYPNKPEEGWSEGLRLVLSKDGKLLTNYGVFFFSCDSYISFVDQFELATQARTPYNLENQAVSDLAFAPANDRAVLARTAGCASQEPGWAQTCGLGPGFEIFAMQLWELAAAKFTDLAPGTMPGWSPDGQWVVFRSCLAKDATGKWQPDANTPAGLYLMNMTDGSLAPLAAGVMPQWRP